MQESNTQSTTHSNGYSTGTVFSIGTLIIASIALFVSQFISGLYVEPQYTDRTDSVIPLTVVQEKLIESFKQNRRLMGVTLEDSRTGYVSENNRSFYGSEPTNWYHNDGSLKLNETEQHQLEAVAGVTLPWGLTREVPIMAFEYNALLQTIHFSFWFGIIFGALLSRVELGTKNTALWRPFVALLATSAIAALLLAEFGLLASTTFVSFGLLSYGLFTFVLWASARIRLPRRTAASQAPDEIEPDEDMEDLIEEQVKKKAKAA